MATKIALILSGGAPNATLMSGALAAFEERGARFDVVSTSGAGALIGLMWAAPKGIKPLDSLRRTIDMGVSDAIYQRFSVNYKVFNKSGAAADAFRNVMQPWLELIDSSNKDRKDPQAQLLSDWMRLGLAALCPTDLNAESLGLCAHPPFLDDVIDFDALRKFGGSFYINAWNITRRKMQIWGKHAINADHCKAALAFPFLYPPYRIGDDFFYEGAVRDCLNYKALLEKEPEVGTIVVFDVLGLDKLIRPPRNLYDAWVQSIIAPLVAVAKDDTAIFELKHNRGPNRRKLLKVKFQIPDDRYAEVLDWSRSNLEYLFGVGHRAGHAFCDEHHALLFG